MKLKGIIFDVDGTIADTEEIHRNAFNATFSDFKLDWHWSKSEYHKLLFISGGKERIKKCLEQDMPLKNNVDFIKKLHDCKSENYRLMLLESNIELRPGIKRLLNEAKAKNITLGIATNSSTANFNILMQKTMDVDPNELFSTIVTSDVVSNKKPSPEVYIRALSNLNLSASNCIAIEDTANGNTSALNADLPTVITTHAYTVDNDFTGSSLVLNNLGEPNSDFISSDEFDCKRGYVDIELLNDIMKERYRFFIKKKLDRKINSEYKK